MSTYVLGHSDAELGRLATQARLIDPITRRFLVDAGVREGMRVLDFGTGAGDVAFLAAELVGPSGEVLGIDRAGAAVNAARDAAARRALRNVSFVEGDPAQLTFGRPFDAVIGRYVLQFQPNPGAVLGSLCLRLRPGGIVAFHEVDHQGAGSSPRVESYDRCCEAVTEALQKGGADTSMGETLAAVFAAAGLPTPTTSQVSLEGESALRIIADLASTLGVPASFERMREETLACQGKIVGHTQVGAWAVHSGRNPLAGP
jgi:ubiquinone/menaquinone biosynthesis C-methylase UbiE